MAWRYYLKWASSESPEDDRKNDQAAQSAISLHKSLGKFFQCLAKCMQRTISYDQSLVVPCFSDGFGETPGVTLR